MASATYCKPAQNANFPTAAIHIGAAVIELRRKASDELSGPIARQILEVADILQSLVPPVERLELLAGGR